MRNLIVALLARPLELLTPGSGQRRRAGAPPGVAPDPSVRRAEEAGPGLHGRFGPAWGWTVRPPRSPYGLRGMLDGEGTALIRPYLVAHERHERQEERAARQRWRRVSLVLAADFGVDLDTRDVHTAGVMAW